MYATVTFMRDGKVKSNDLCSFDAAFEYAKDVVMKNGWTLISITCHEYNN